MGILYLPSCSYQRRSRLDFPEIFSPEIRGVSIIVL
uniref:Uncharacterized protein n=1 Tax=Arundo donax TaxID=35708 RepID=A0A0A9EKQ5_ARUDO